jgi:uncharacterized protein (DUF2267 family)
MRYRELLDEVRRAGAPEPAELTISAVLTTLAEELPAGTAGSLATNLPAEVAARVRRPGRGADDEGAHMDRWHFLNRVAQRGGWEPDEAGQWVRTVLTVVSHAVPEAVMVNVAVGVPPDLLDLLPPVPGPR